MMKFSLDSLVSATELQHGGVKRTLDRVEGGEPVVVLRNNKATAVLISPTEYESLLDARDQLTALRSGKLVTAQADSIRARNVS